MKSPKLQNLRNHLTPLAAVAILCAGGAVVVAAISIIRFAGTAASRAGQAAAQTNEQRQLEQFLADVKRFNAQADGRSIFITPKPARDDSADIAADPAPTQPSKPTRYAGPSIIAMVNGAVWFADGQRVEVGKEGRDIRILSLNAPWSARVLWQGVEFDVGLFEHDAVVYKRPLAASGNWVAPTSPMATPGLSPSLPPSSSRSTTAAPAPASGGAALPGRINGGPFPVETPPPSPAAVIIMPPPQPSPGGTTEDPQRLPPPETPPGSAPREPRPTDPGTEPAPTPVPVNPATEPPSTPPQPEQR